ncbi:MAG: hypothetical protein AB8B64_09205 [Granulosicoccus sp.]
MNAYQVMGIIVCCTVIFMGVVTILTMQGVHILVALLGVYLVAIWSMLCMQRKARENFESREDVSRRRFASEYDRHRARSSDFSRSKKVTSLFQE